jgi:hypothetical protein
MTRLIFTYTFYLVYIIYGFLMNVMYLGGNMYIISKEGLPRVLSIIGSIIPTILFISTFLWIFKPILSADIKFYKLTIILLMLNPIGTTMIWSLGTNLNGFENFMGIATSIFFLTSPLYLVLVLHGWKSKTKTQ